MGQGGQAQGQEQGQVQGRQVQSQHGAKAEPATVTAEEGEQEAMFGLGPGCTISIVLSLRPSRYLSLTLHFPSYILTTIYHREVDLAEGYVDIQLWPVAHLRIPFVYRSIEGALVFVPSALHFDFPTQGMELPHLVQQIFALSSCRYKFMLS